MCYSTWSLVLTCLTAVLLCSYPVCHGRRRTKTAERRLHDVLTRVYDVSSRPVQNASFPVTVNLSLSLHHIMDLAEKNQTLITHLWIYEQWYDEMMTWRPERFEGLDHIVLPSYKLWLPDLYLFNNADKGRLGMVTVEDSRTLVWYTGLVQWTLPLITKTSCAVDVTYFPFDSQKCFIRMGSWIYEESQLNLTLASENVDMSKFSENSEMDLVRVEINRDLLFYELLGGRYPQITVSMSIKRRPLFYAYTVIAPTLVLCVMALFSFLLPCDNGDKVGIGLTVFLSLYVLQLAIAENIPESDSLPLIGVFLTLVMTLNALSLVFATLVINLKKKGDRYYCPPVPRFLLSSCKLLLAKFTCTPFFNFYQFYGHCEEDILLNDLPTCENGHTSGDPVVPSTSKSEVSELSEETNLRHRKKKTCSESDPDVTELASRLEPEQPERDIRYEWYFVAEVLDKTLFLFFICALIAIITVPLVLIPWLHSDDAIKGNSSSTLQLQ